MQTRIDSYYQNQLQALVDQIDYANADAQRSFISEIMLLELLASCTPLREIDEVVSGLQFKNTKSKDIFASHLLDYFIRNANQIIARDVALSSERIETYAELRYKLNYEEKINTEIKDIPTDPAFYYVIDGPVYKKNPEFYNSQIHQTLIPNRKAALQSKQQELKMQCKEQATQFIQNEAYRAFVHLIVGTIEHNSKNNLWKTYRRFGIGGVKTQIDEKDALLSSNVHAIYKHCQEKMKDKNCNFKQLFDDITGMGMKAKNQRFTFFRDPLARDLYEKLAEAHEKGLPVSIKSKL